MATRSAALPMNLECCSVLVEPIAEDHAAELAKGFAALADPVRLRLFSMIAAAGGACSCDLVEPIGPGSSSSCGRHSPPDVTAATYETLAFRYGGVSELS